MDCEQILNTYISGSQTGEDNKLRATIGKLTADRSKDLANAINGLHQQIPVTLSELRETITKQEIPIRLLFLMKN